MYRNLYNLNLQINDKALQFVVNVDVAEKSLVDL